MDLSSINKAKLNDNNVAFSGSKFENNDAGERYFRVFPQNIELNDNEELGVELIRMSENKSKLEPYGFDAVSLKPLKVEADEDFKNGKKSYLDIDLKKYRLKNAAEFGFRYVVYDKNTKETKRAYTDSTGTVIKHNNMEFTVASSRQGNSRNEGPMEHIYTDSWNTLENIKQKAKKRNPSISDEHAIDDFRRNHVNKAGGTINGITEKLDTELASYPLIMTTPLIGGGGVSSHGYHPKNHFQVTDGLGTKQDFLNLQKACFERGKGYVLDGAFTSQGYEGMQLNHAMKWYNSPFKYWFKNPQELGFELGVLSDTDNSHTGIRVVNPMGVEGYKYDSSMPTYIQFYDTRLAKNQLDDFGALIKDYDLAAADDDPYEISTWHDGILPNYFEVDPHSKSVYGMTYGTLDAWDKKGRLKDVLNPDNMPRSFTKRGLTGGITGWDGAVDLVKMNLSNHENSVEMRQGNNQAKNYMFNIAKYWTRTTRNELIMDVAQNLHKNGDISSSKNKKYLHKLESNHGLDENKLNDIAIGIAKDKKDYASGILNNKPASKLIKEKILDFPLESLNFSPELLAVLSTPYITPRPSADGNPAADALEIYEDAKRNTHVKLSKTAQKIYDETLPAQIKDLMCTIQKEQNDSSRNFFEFDGDGISEITPYGRYFLEFAMDDMMNFFITEGLFDGDNKASYKDGFLDYTAADENTKGDGKRLTLNKLKIKEATPENEAEAVVKKIKSGIEKIKISKPKEYQKFKNYLEQKYCQIDTAEYKIAEAVVDKTKAGLNWRFDATKDVGDFDEAKQGLLTSAQVMDDVIDFWQPFMQAIRKYNPSFYCIAEVTSLGDFNNYDWGKYKNAQTAEANFYEITGATTGSNYSTYFGIYPKLFGQNTEEGNIENFRSISNFMDETYKFVHPDDSKGRIPSEFIIGSHVFLDNQDKPRTSHLMGIDAKLFWSDFKQNEDYKYRAENVLKRQYDDNMSSKAVAVGEKYLEYFEAEGKKIGLDKSQIDLLKEAVSHLANGYKFTKPNVKTALKPDFNRASAFGATPYEISIPLVIKQAQALGLEIDENTKAKLTDAVWFDMVKPYASKMPAIYEMMRGTVGIPTIFSGDDLLQTGAEARSKNWYLGNRNPIRHDWLDEHAKQEVIDFNTRIQKNNELSNKPGMSALSNGTPVVVLPDVIGASTKNEIIEGAAALNDGDLRNAFGFLNSAKSGSKEDILNELKSLDEDELKTKLGSQLSKVNFGLASWVRKNINPALLQDCQQGAVYKYNDKNEGVLSIFTNAYIDKNENKITPLVDLADDKKPRLSSITLKDNDGNLIAKPGTVFVRKTYSNQKCDYVDDGIFVLNADGKLIRQNGSDSTLDSTVTYFCKYNPFYTNYSKTIG